MHTVAVDRYLVLYRVGGRICPISLLFIPSVARFICFIRCGCCMRLGKEVTGIALKIDLCFRGYRGQSYAILPQKREICTLRTMSTPVPSFCSKPSRTTKLSQLGHASVSEQIDYFNQNCVTTVSIFFFVASFWMFRRNSWVFSDGSSSKTVFGRTSAISIFTFFVKPTLGTGPR